MLAGFVVPHAHYRVFHGDPAADSQHAAPNDQFPLALSPRRAEKAPTDLHLREFAQLEVQVKALQLQAAQHASPVAMGAAVAGPLAECFLFYSRLFTVESFPWPDFLAAVFTKLAEHFASSDNEIVRSAILRVFQRAKAHVAQVNDPAKLLGHLSPPLADLSSGTARTLTLQMLATMPSLLLHDTVVQQQILKGVHADDRDERSAAIEAARALLPLSPSFRKDVLTLGLEGGSAALCGLLADAVSSSVEAQEAWTHCAGLYERFADDKSAVASVRAMTTLTAAYPDVLLASHGQLLHHVLDHEPRAVVRNFALLATQQLVATGGDDDEQLTIALEGVFSRIGQLPTTSGKIQTRLKLSALLLLEKWAATGQELGESAELLLKEANGWLATATDERFGEAYTSIVAHIARRKLSRTDAVSPERSMDELLLLLHPRAAVISKSTWNHALVAIAQLSKEFPVVIATSKTYWRDRAEAIEAEVLVCLTGAGTGGLNSNSSIYDIADSSRDEKLVQYRVRVNLPVAWDQVVEATTEEVGDCQSMLYLPFETPVHVKAASLTQKGSFVLMARIALTDRHGERWPLAATGCRRGFIVY
ncbi:Armadillo-type fold [Phytophthora cinnamomi]|uniref:Armadillo-type fold n=1 Tax=Phytophthora cinnamomi TaxID=4785 RepID=UPI00355A5442|nr:Armadillo-type fold [Phytophthora cinnamomi]